MKSSLPRFLHQATDRRFFLRSACASLALPSLESLRAEDSPAEKQKASNFVAIGTYLGWHPAGFFPREEGAGYTMPPTLAPLESQRELFTIFSGLDHQAVGGHGGWSNFLCGQKIKTYSLDQQIAEQLGGRSQFRSLELAAGMGEGSTSMSYNRSGVGLPMLRRPSVLFEMLFPNEEQRKRRLGRMSENRSLLDQVRTEARSLQKQVSQRDADALEQYFTSLREVEQGIEQQSRFLKMNKREVKVDLPPYDPITPSEQLEAADLLYELLALALENGSTHVASVFLDGLGQVFTIDGHTLRSGYHGLSHHGNDPGMLKDLILLESSHITCLARFLDRLQACQVADSDRSLLDDTIVLVGTGLGDAAIHTNKNLPTLVAGGGFQHGRHLRVNKEKPEYLLGDLYTTLQQRLGLEVESFSNGKGNLNHLFS